METWFLILISLCICSFLKSIFNQTSKKTKNFSYSLPPGPPTFPVIGNIRWLRMTVPEIEPILRSLHAKLGPMVTLQLGSRPTIFIADRSLAHQALIQNGAIFAERPPPYTTDKIANSDQLIISSSFYGPTWRLLRRNLSSEVLHPSRVKSYSHARKWALQILQNRLESESKTNHHVLVQDYFQFAMFCLLVLMCFGNKFDEDLIKQIKEVQRQVLISFSGSNALNFWPRVTKIIWRKKWERLYKLRKLQENILLPLIRERKRLQEEMTINEPTDERNISKEQLGGDDHYVVAYVDTLLGLELPDGKRKLEEGEMVSVCSEFLNGGTDTTSTALEWIMANLVKDPELQERLFLGIKGVMEDGTEEVKEEDLQKMPYLKAVILEGLRRHPPAHLVLPHAVTEDTILDNYLIPKNGTVNFMVAEMGLDPKVWEDPMAFKPERFLKGGVGEGFDITGSREIKMMPFGVGRRICPGLGLAMLHLEYFVANLIWRYEWKAVDGYGVDLSEKQEFTMVMKNPLKAHISPRLT